MYKGFQLELSEDRFSKLYDKNFHSDTTKREFFNWCQEIAPPLSKNKKEEGENEKQSVLLLNKASDGTEIKEDWFPQVKAHIFISHSHKDEPLAMALAGWLYKTFGLTAFIDSCVWGYYIDLQKKLEELFSSEGNDENAGIDSASHAYIMLAMALAQMIDNTECLFFLNTPNSITPDSFRSRTISPWIFSEIGISRIIRKRSPEEHGKLLAEATTRERPRIEYTLQMEHLPKIEVSDLTTWGETYISHMSQTKESKNKDIGKCTNDFCSFYNRNFNFGSFYNRMLKVEGKPTIPFSEQASSERPLDFLYDLIKKKNKNDGQ